MSWCRFGSPCQVAGCFVDGPCHPGLAECPGSDVYVFDNTDGYIECCGCSLNRPRGERDFWTKDDAAMRAHLREHVAAGHHVWRSLYDETLRARVDAWWESLGLEGRLRVAMGCPGIRLDRFDGTEVAR